MSSTIHAKIRNGGDEPATAADRYSRGLTFYRLGRYRDALQELGAIADGGDPIGRMARFYRAMCHRAIGIEALAGHEFDLAEEHLQAAIGLVGRTGDLAIYLASLYAGTGRFSRCVDQMSRVLDLEGDSPATWRKLALAQWRRGDRAGACMTVNQALRRLGDNCQTRLQLGLFHAADGRLDLARQALSEAVRADTSAGDAHYYLALVLAAGGEPLAAMQSFQRALDLRPDDLLAAYQLALTGKAVAQAGGAVTIRLPRPVESVEGSGIRQLAGYVCREPDYLAAFLALPDTGADAAMFGLLAAVLQIATGEHPEYADLRHLYSRVLARLGRVDAAIAQAERALAINPRYVQALIHAARLYELAGRDARAIDCLKKAIASGADWADIQRELGDLLRRAGGDKRNAGDKPARQFSDRSTGPVAPAGRIAA